MASSGYLVSVGSKSSEGKTKAKEDLEKIISEGVYATWLTESKDGKWSSATYGTLADYATIKPGDNIYFFADRKIYGIGEVIDRFGEKQAAFALDNSLDDSYSKRLYSEDSTHRKKVKDEGVKVQRWGVVFKPAPFFFSEGVDMDDLLNSDPSAFRSLRVFWKRSFIQFDEKENAAFKSALLRLNEAVLNSDSANGKLPACLEKVNLESGEWESTPLSLKRLLSEDSNPCETLVEAGLISSLIREEESAMGCFGKWDFVTRQIPASPFKPVDYMDRTDVFGWRFIPDVPEKPKHEPRFVSKYLLVEIKNERITNRKVKANINQLMKYVEWVCQEYAHGDYSMIEAFLVAPDFSTAGKRYNENLIKEIKESVTRNYVTGHEANSHSWANIKLAAYSVNEESGKMGFEVCYDFSK